MRKKTIFTILWIISSILILLFIANEYFKRVEQKAINNYINSLKSELQEAALLMEFSPTLCNDLFNHKCNIANASINGKKIRLNLQNIDVAISNLSYDRVEVKSSIGDIKGSVAENIPIPKIFSYTLKINKVDSKLGYINLSRHISAKFDDFEFSFELSVLLRDKIFRDKNIIWILKEWFDGETPSFYEYSVNNISAHLNIDRNNKELQKLLLYVLESSDILQNANLSVLDEKINDALNGTIKKISLDIHRKNDDLIFFDKLTSDARVKKTMEIRQTLQSIDETYEVKILAK